MSFTVGGTATAGSDYAALPQTVVIPAGASSAAITVRPTDDTGVEPNETVVVTLKAGTGYTVGASSSATVSVVDNDAAITIDNGGTGTSFTGTWLVSLGPNPHGSTSLYCDGRRTGHVPMDAHHPHDAYLRRLRVVDCVSEPILRRPVPHCQRRGTTVTTRDQRTGGGQWQYLGTFQFNAGTAGYVQVSDVNGGTVSADAIRWVPRHPPCTESDTSWRDRDRHGRPGTLFTGQWSSSGGSNPYENRLALDAGSGQDTYLWRPTIPSLSALRRLRVVDGVSRTDPRASSTALSAPWGRR